MNALPSSLLELFPEKDFRFHLTLRRSELADFFRPQDSSGALLGQRRRWIESDPGRYLGLQSEGENVLDEFSEQAAAWDFSPLKNLPTELARRSESGLATLQRLGGSLEPDFAVLSPDASGFFRLRAGAVCFPTGWALSEKLGLTLDSIHGVVPGLNEALSSPIQQFLARLKPGPAFLRSNWGIAASEELNLHPSRQLPAPRLPLRLDQLWLRVEHQGLAVLPRTAGILFAIRIERFRLDQVSADAAIAGGLHRALATMPDAVLAYKGLAAIREALLAALKKS